jgi:hypothetical protein
MEAALNLQPDDASANDNDGPDRHGDKWWLIITGFRRIHEPLAVFAAKRKLTGQTADDFIDEFLSYAKALGWPI